MSAKNSKKTTQTPPPGVFCAHVRVVLPAELKPHPRNPNRHPKAQLKLLAEVIEKNGWRGPVVVSKRSGYIIKGHARHEVATMRGWPVPVDDQDYATEADEMADMVADNKIAELAESDDAEIGRILEEFAGDEDEARFGILAAEEEEADVKSTTIKPAPKMGFALIGCPIEEFGAVQTFLETLPKHFHVSTTATDQGAPEGEE